MRGYVVLILLFICTLCLFHEGTCGKTSFIPPDRQPGMTDEAYAAVMSKAIDDIIQTPDVVYSFMVNGKTFYGKVGHGVSPDFEHEFISADSDPPPPPPQQGPIYLNDQITPFDEQSGRNAAKTVAFGIVDGLRQEWKSGRGFALTPVYTIQNCQRALQGAQAAAALQRMKRADSTLLFVLPVFYEELAETLDNFFVGELRMGSLKNTPEMNQLIKMNTECVKPPLMDLRF